MVHVANIFQPIKVHPDWKIWIAALISNEALITISVEYLNFENVFSKESATVLLEYIEINIHTIDLKKGKLLPYRPMYSLKPVELETPNTYIETNLANGFIYPLKSPTGTPILFDKNLEGSFWLCVNYRGLKNITIKN